MRACLSAFEERGFDPELPPPVYIVVDGLQCVEGGMIRCALMLGP